MLPDLSHVRQPSKSFSDTTSSLSSSQSKELLSCLLFSANSNFRSVIEGIKKIDLKAIKKINDEDEHGAVYVGEVDAAGKKQGYGVLNALHSTIYSSSGDISVGKFDDGQMSGPGVTVQPNHYTYIGHFQKGFYDGLGLRVSENSRRYEGYFKDGLQHGYGKLTDGEDGTLLGQWDKGMFSGYGISTNKNGRVIDSGLWVDGKFNKKAVIPSNVMENIAAFKDEIESMTKLSQELVKLENLKHLLLEQEALQFLKTKIQKIEEPQPQASCCVIL